MCPNVTVIMTPVDTLGQRIKLARQAAGLRQVDLAQAVGVSLTAVKNWERGVVTPKDRIGRLQQVLGVDLTEIGTGPHLIDASVPLILGHLGNRFANLNDRVREQADTIASLRAEVEGLRSGAITVLPQPGSRPRLVGRPRDNGNGEDTKGGKDPAAETSSDVTPDDTPDPT